MLGTLGVAVLCLGIAAREWSWRSLQSRQEGELLSLSEQNENLLLRLQIEVAAQVCSSTEDSTLSTSRFLELGAALLAHKDKGLKPNNIQTEGVFFDLAGVAQVVLFTLMAGAEYRFLHQPHLNRAGEEEHEQAVKRELSDFLLRKYPITAILVFSCVGGLAILAWWGVIPRDKFVGLGLKTVVALLLASPLAFISHNMARMRTYLPTGEEWFKVAADWQWWVWLLARLGGVYDIRSGTKTLLWVVCLSLYLWPVRYFFYYRHCGPLKEPGNSIFLVNMLAQGSVLVGCWCVCPSTYGPSDISSTTATAVP
eukprot:CAMPEP_0173285980 /NCGR_PEP_ID=MMETSP1143-20121109/8925_1 /TAXON_ID=483371 /ORGANISM="non described non described, Strain CCMP2298" /LENGTH=310 /DNA_ID=CAMNT_0014224219 /DNA_START=389 /DNA_END=1321 /DNA_ORIENTATION=-